MLVTEQISYIFCFGFEHLNAWDFFFLIWGFSLRRYLFYLSFEKKKTTQTIGVCVMKTGMLCLFVYLFLSDNLP